MTLTIPWLHIEDKVSVQKLWSYENGEDAFLVSYKMEEVLRFGYSAPRENQRWLWAKGKPKAARTFRVLERWAREYWLPYLFETQGVTRIEIRLSQSHKNINWLKRFGMREECIVHHANTSGEPSVQLSFTKDDYIAGRFLQSEAARRSPSGEGTDEDFERGSS